MAIYILNGSKDKIRRDKWQKKTGPLTKIRKRAKK